MEYGLRHTTMRAVSPSLSVLILVVMEYGLRQVLANSHNV